MLVSAASPALHPLSRETRCLISPAAPAQLPFDTEPSQRSRLSRTFYGGGSAGTKLAHQQPGTVTVHQLSQRARAPAACPPPFPLKATAASSDCENGVICWVFTAPPTTGAVSAGACVEAPIQGGGTLPALSAALLRGRRFQAQSKQLFLHPTEPCATAPGGRAAVLTLPGTDCSLGSRQRNSCLRLHTERFELCWAHQSTAPPVLASRASF